MAALLPQSWSLPDYISEEFCWKLLFWQTFFKHFGCVFPRSNTILAISQEWLVRLMWNEKEVHWLDTGYNMWHWPFTSLVTFTLDVSRSNFEIAIFGIVGLIDVKWKGSESIWYWADCMTLPFDHTHDLDLGVSRSESEIALSQEWGDQLTMNEKDVSHPIMTMILTCVTMVGWADVPDSDRGDFRCWRAIDISSLGQSYDCISAGEVALKNMGEWIAWIPNEQGAVSIRKTVLPGMAIPMLKIRRPNGRLIFNMENAIRR